VPNIERRLQRPNTTTAIRVLIDEDAYNFRRLNCDEFWNMASSNENFRPWCNHFSTRSTEKFYWMPGRWSLEFQVALLEGQLWQASQKLWLTQLSHWEQTPVALRQPAAFHRASHLEWRPKPDSRALRTLREGLFALRASSFWLQLEMNFPLTILGQILARKTCILQSYHLMKSWPSLHRGAIPSSVI